MPIAKVHRISAAAPDDVSGIEAAIAAGRINPGGVIAVLGKTEGNGLVNDFSRGLANLQLALLFRRFMPDDEAAKICLVMSGGTEGAMAPHWIVFERMDGNAGGRPALAIGRAHTGPLAFQHLGRRPQVDAVADGVRAAMADAGIAQARDVHFVQIKCPLLTAARIGEADRRGETVAAPDTFKSMGLSRAASALGAAVALGEIDGDTFSDADIGTRWELWSDCASSFGRRRASRSRDRRAWHVGCVVGSACRRACGNGGRHRHRAGARRAPPARYRGAGQIPAQMRERLIAVLAKAEASHDGRLRGQRHTMLDDSDIAATRHARAFVCGALAGLVGHAEIYVSGGAEHQGPDGGGPVAVIVDREAAG